MHIPTCLPKEENSGPLTTPACPTKGEKPPLASFLPVYRNPQAWENSPAVSPGHPLVGQSSGGGNQKDAFHFHRMHSSKDRRGSKSEFKLLFTRNQYFHEIILLGRGWITEIPGGKTWLSGDCGMDVTGQGSQNGDPHPLTSQNSRIQLFLSQTSTQSVPGAQGPLPGRGGCRN